MLFSNLLPSLPGDILFDNVQILEVSSTRFRGLIIDNKLFWTIYNENLRKLISRNIGIINKK